MKAPSNIDKLTPCIQELNQLSLNMGDIGYRYSHTMTFEQREDFIRVHTTIMKLVRDTKKRLTALKDEKK